MSLNPAYCKMRFLERFRGLLRDQLLVDLELLVFLDKRRQQSFPTLIFTMSREE